MHIWVVYVHMYTKYEVSMLRTWARKGVCRQHQQLHMTDKACLYKALWLINQMSQKLKWIQVNYWHIYDKKIHMICTDLKAKDNNLNIH